MRCGFEQDLSHLLNLIIGITTSLELIEAAESIKKARNDCAHATTSDLVLNNVKTYIRSIRGFVDSLTVNSAVVRERILAEKSHILEESINRLEETILDCQQTRTDTNRTTTNGEYTSLEVEEENV